MLTAQLPAKSATGHATGQAWTHTDEAITSLVELLHHAITWLRAIAGDKTARRVKPLRIPRPTDPPKPKPTTDPRRIRDFFMKGR